MTVCVPVGSSISLTSMVSVLPAPASRLTQPPIPTQRPVLRSSPGNSLVFSGPRCSAASSPSTSTPSSQLIAPILALWALAVQTFSSVLGISAGFQHWPHLDATTKACPFSCSPFIVQCVGPDFYFSCPQTPIITYTQRMDKERDFGVRPPGSGSFIHWPNTLGRVTQPH